MPVTNKALLSQIHLSGEVECSQFQPHMLKANFCTACSKLINKHSPEAIPSDDCLLKGLEYSQKGEKVPTCILQPSPTHGGLYHGGFKGVMNQEFLKREKITHVVNTAKGLEIFGPKYMSAVETAKTVLGLSFLELNWEDTTSFTISDQGLVDCVNFIHSARKGGGSVLVHCAQGKSRSATAVIAYLMAADGGKSFDESLKLVQEQRKMAEPNPTFEQRLREFGKSDTLRKVQTDLMQS